MSIRTMVPTLAAGDSHEEAVATLARAQELVRQHRRTTTTDGERIEVLVHPGTYAGPVELDSPQLDSHVTWRGVGGANASRLIGGVVLSNLTWTRAASSPQIYKAKLLSATLPPSDGEGGGGEDALPALFINGHRLWRSRWPNYDWSNPSAWGKG